MSLFKHGDYDYDNEFVKHKKKDDLEALEIEESTKIILSSGNQVLVPNVSFEHIDKQVQTESGLLLSFIVTGDGWSNLVPNGYIATDQIATFYSIKLDKISNERLRNLIKISANYNKNSEYSY